MPDESLIVRPQLKGREDERELAVAKRDLERDWKERKEGKEKGDRKCAMMAS